MTENSSPRTSKAHLVLKNPLLPLIFALVILIIFDLITWERPFGAQFLITTMLILLSFNVLAASERKHIPWTSFLLLVPIVGGALMTIIYRAASTNIFNILIALSGLTLFAITLLNGQWHLYRIREMLMGALLLTQSMLIDPIRVLIVTQKSRVEISQQYKSSVWRKAWPYLLGVLIATPLLLILGALLASADLIFRQNLSSLIEWFRVENLVEFIFRVTYILIFAYMLAGAFIHAISQSAEKKVLHPDQPLIAPFLSHTVAFTVLTLVNLLFLMFILVQFRYFFAGQANITLEGFTYAEYARRGFFELIVVAIISLGIHYLLSMVTKRDSPASKRIFSALGLLLMLQVGVMLISAFQRLSLYEAAFGFTVLRTITHIFMIWLGVLLAAVALMEVSNQFKRLALVLFLVFFGFTLTLNLVNVDRFIAIRNIDHAIAGHPLDANYLIRHLSNDSIPALFAYAQAEQTPPQIKDSLNGILACRFALRKTVDQKTYWAAWNLSSARADALFEQNHAQLESFSFIIQSDVFTYEHDGQQMKTIYADYFIDVNGEEVWCKSGN